MTNKKKDIPQVSVVIPVYNEEESLPTLFARLYPAMDALGRRYECVFVDDGSHDRSAALLRGQFAQRPDVTRVVLLQSNFGQHAAILAGFSATRGERVITLDADLQNPPEEIGNLLAKMDEGYDYIGTIRRKRQDAAWRRLASRMMNRLRERITRVRMTDQGCMLRAYSREVIDAINNTSELNTFIPALAYLYATKPVEIEVEHNERQAGRSKYSLYRLIRLNFDLVTGFSVMPLQIFSIAGFIITILAGILVVYMVVDRFVEGPQVQGVFTLFAIAFFLIGIALFGIGLLGEYVGRIYQEVQRRPRYLVRAILENKNQDD
ncbi:MAG: glycosyltransferase [Gammaproteobacteria bacterium]|nr:glycosyltransferase [Gammaproteobacteria bacterium]MDE2140373.1 glycosyltransferase [Gammaproteobacteria bacterium]